MSSEGSGLVLPRTPEVRSAPSVAKDGRSRGWCFTVNNYTVDDEEYAKVITCEYIIYGREVGEEKTPHLQGYVYFKTKKSMSQVKVLLPRAHLETTRGSSVSNIRYCSKEDPNPFSKGVPPKTKQDQGRIERERWDSYKRSAKAGNLENLPSKIYIQNYTTLKQIHCDNMKKAPNAEQCTGLWLYGGYGSGKSHLARTTYPDAYIKNATKWWDGYQGQDQVIFEDMDPFLKGMARHFKIWGDKWNFPAEIKRSTINIRPKLFIVTSQYLPEQIWDDVETIGAIRDRFIITKLPGKSRRKKKARVNPFANFGEDSEILKKPKLSRQNGYSSSFSQALLEEEAQLQMDEQKAPHVQEAFFPDPAPADE